MMSPWERFFNKDLCFELPAHRWSWGSWNFCYLKHYHYLKYLYASIRISSSGLWQSSPRCLGKGCFCSFPAPRLSSLGPSSTKVAWVSLQSCCPSHSLWWEDRKCICSRLSGHLIHFSVLSQEEPIINIVLILGSDLSIWSFPDQSFGKWVSCLFY